MSVILVSLAVIFLGLFGLMFWAFVSQDIKELDKTENQSIRGEQNENFRD